MVYNCSAEQIRRAISLVDMLMADIDFYHASRYRENLALGGYYVPDREIWREPDEDRPDYPA